MPIQAAQGVFTARTAAGTTTITTGFQPKAVIFWGTLQTATGFGPTGGYASHLLGIWAQDGSRTALD